VLRYLTIELYGAPSPTPPFGRGTKTQVQPVGQSLSVVQLAPLFGSLGSVVTHAQHVQAPVLELRQLGSALYSEPRRSHIPHRRRSRTPWY
jgi:hypothetical protein